ncbi:MAG: DUF1573 domain-containing protein [Verrucomicrobiota bacterium]
MLGWLQAAALDFPVVFKEVHAPADAKTVTVDFEFANHTDKPVNVTKYDAACSCISVQIKEGKLRYAPGEAGLIRTEFDMGNFSGAVDKMVAVWLDDDAPDKPSLALTVRVHIPVLVALEPKTLKWDLNGTPEAKTIHIQMNYQKPIRVISVNSSSEAFKYELKTLEDGRSYDLVVTPTDMRTPGLGIFRIETDCLIPKHRIQQAFATVRKPSPAPAAVKP